MARDARTVETIVSDLDIQALVDEELSDEHRARVCACLSGNAGLRERYEQLLAQRRMIAAAWDSLEKTRLH